MKTYNPFAKWPRNYPCFCGSGRKFKKCHQPDLNPHCTLQEADKLRPDFERMLDYVEHRKQMGVGYKLRNKAL